MSQDGPLVLGGCLPLGRATMTDREARTRFVVVLEPHIGCDDSLVLRSLRAFLKTCGRRLRLRCVSCTEQRGDQ